MNRKPKSIVCIERTANEPAGNTFLKDSAKIHRRELHVDSVAHMVDRVIRRLRGRSIQDLCIIGHGAPGRQSVGNGDYCFLGNGMSLVMRKDAFQLDGDGVEGQIKRLNTLFAPGGRLVLGGCRVAAEDIGKGLLMRLSVLLNNVPVEAGEDKQYPPKGMEGPVVRCVGSSYCIVTSRGVCDDADD